MHFYLDLLLIKLAYYLEFISCFCFSAWSQQVCYEFTVGFNCNSMITIIVLIVSIKFEELTRKKNIGFETVDDEYLKLRSSLVVEIINCILV